MARAAKSSHLPPGRQAGPGSGTIGMADALDKRIVCVFYKVTLNELRRDGDGLGPMEDMNIVDINALDAYFVELAQRVRTHHG